MSTIEEAREQARETLADYQRVNAGGYGAGNHTYLARALRALLDATEPQDTTTPAAEAQLEAVTSAIEKVLDGQGALHCTRVWEAWGYGTMSEEDFSPVADDAEAVHEIASAVLEALDATEPPAHDGDCEADWGPEGQESPCRCATPTDRPAEDEREALVALLESPQHAPMNTHNGADGSCMDCPWPLHMMPPGDVADALLAAGVRVGPRPITDEMVDAALDAWFDHADSGAYSVEAMRAVLEAAEEARR